MNPQIQPGDYDVVRCPGPGAPHSLAIPKFPVTPFASLFCEKCRGFVRVTPELRQQLWTDPPA